MRDRHVVITGATGFLGSHVLRQLLAAGATVTALVRHVGQLPEHACLYPVAADLAGDFSASLARIGNCDDVVHLAQTSGWSAFPAKAGMLASVAVAATTRLAEHAAATGARRFVLASSGGIYGPSTRPICEDEPYQPSAELGFYLASKVAAEMLVAYFSPYLTVHRLRYFFIYGPGQREEFLIPRMVRSVRCGTPVRLARGRGPRLNPIYVEDAARATVACLRLETPLVANIAGPEVANLAAIVETIGRIVACTPVCEAFDADPQDYVAETTVMDGVLGKAVMPLAAGLAAAASS